ncbi:MAG: pyridoxal 5'-phosphate synthase glutaminase subunit PdxT [Methanobrevibacter sp.]
MLKIGILNLQGAVSEHYDMMRLAIKHLGIEACCENVRYAEDVESCDGVVISGGESTVIGKIIFERGIDKVIKKNNIPVFGTCAGVVLLARNIDFKDQKTLEMMDIDVERNAFGSQKNSFETEISILGEKFNGVFIRAPSIIDYDKTKKDIEVLSRLDNQVIAIKQGHNIACTFHPELTDNTLIHEYFIKEVEKCVE